MKEFSLLVWLTQTGISVAAPLAAAVFLAVWLRNQFGLGVWVLWVGIVLGVLCAVNSFIQSLRLMEQMAGRGRKDDPPPTQFNEHF